MKKMKKFAITITDVVEIEAPTKEAARKIVLENTGRNALIQEIEEVDNFTNLWPY